MINRVGHTSPAVNYSLVASQCAHGRQLDGHDLDTWREAIEVLCPIRGSTVVDLGAGTGIFTRAWHAWGADLVVGCEPSPAMRDEMLRGHSSSGLGARGFALVAGRAEQIPTVADCADTVWLSNVLHHIDDVDAWIAETRRVLKPGGMLLVRNLFSDLGSIAWTEGIPEGEKGYATFPRADDLVARLGDAGGILVRRTEVAESRGGRTRREAAAWIDEMRDVDSLLAHYTDQQLRSAIGRLQSIRPDEPLGPSRLGFVAFRFAGIELRGGSADSDVASMRKADSRQR